MHYVYILKSTKFDQTYVGLAQDLEARLKDHNDGKSPHTSKYKPWEILAYFAFKDRQKAAQFEIYLKSGSGRAFINKRIR